MRLIALAISLLLAAPAWADVTVDTTSTKTQAGQPTTVNWSHTNSGNLILCSAHIFSTGVSVSTFTYAGVALTPIVRVESLSSTGHIVDLWRLSAPAQGSNTVEFTLSSAGNSIGACTSFSGTNTTTPVGTHATDSASGATTGSGSITIPVGGLGYDVWTYGDDASFGLATPGGDQSERFDLADTDATMAGAGSTKSISGATTMSYSQTNADRVAYIAVPINAAPATTKRPASAIFFP